MKISSQFDSLRADSPSIADKLAHIHPTGMHRVDDGGRWNSPMICTEEFAGIESGLH